MSVKRYIFKAVRLMQRLLNLQAEIKISNRKKSLSKIHPQGTSWSDANDYLSICKLAAKYDDIFETFKRSKDYRTALEHVSKKQGQAYLDIIKVEGQELLASLSKFKENDKYGKPFTFNYEVGKLSPTTLRYIKVLMDLKNIFGSLSGLDIVEIGGGYGGQCKIISDIFMPKTYTIIDLDEVLSLTEKYLMKLNVKNVTLLNPQSIDSDQRYDLVISNYAFSECLQKVQKFYTDKILSRSKRGYLTCNFNAPTTSTTPHNKAELCQILSGMHTIEILDELPKTGSDNYIIIWDDSKKEHRQ